MEGWQHTQVVMQQQQHRQQPTTLAAPAHHHMQQQQQQWSAAAHTHPQHMHHHHAVPPPPPMPSYYAPLHHHHHHAVPPYHPTYPPAPAPPPPPMPPGPAALRRRAAHRKTTHRGPSGRTQSWGQATHHPHHGSTARTSSGGVLQGPGALTGPLPTNPTPAPLLHSSSAPVLSKTHAAGAPTTSSNGAASGSGGGISGGGGIPSHHHHHHPHHHHHHPGGGVRPWEVALPDADRLDDGDDELQESESDVPGMARGGGRARRAKQQWASGRSGILALEKELRELDTTVRSTLHNPASEMVALSSHSVANHVCVGMLGFVGEQEKGGVV